MTFFDEIFNEIEVDLSCLSKESLRNFYLFMEIQEDKINNLESIISICNSLNKQLLIEIKLHKKEIKELNEGIDLFEAEKLLWYKEESRKL